MSTEQQKMVVFPLIQSIEGCHFPAPRLEKIAGFAVEATRFDEHHGAVITTLGIIQALGTHPQSMYWKGYFNSQQPGSYGQLQRSVVNPEFYVLGDTVRVVVS